jgi:hypothetical protein
LKSQLDDRSSYTGPMTSAVATGPQRIAVATVQGVHPRPWGRSETVDLRFVPVGGAEPVLAIDEIDIGSVSGLVKGSVVRVVYPVADPKLALITGATHRFRWRDPLGGWGPMIVFLAVGLLVVTLVRFVRRRGGRAVAR